MELDKLIKHQNIINYVKAQILSWFGHVHRKHETTIVRKKYKWQPYVTRPVGRPKHRWDDDVRNDLRRMKLLKWSEQAQDRLEWKKMVEKAKTLHELQCLLRRSFVDIVRGPLVQIFRSSLGSSVAQGSLYNKVGGGDGLFMTVL